MAGIIRKMSGNLLLLATIMVAVCVGSSLAATYTVGGSTGWTLPPSTNFYPTWASQQIFQVGDILVFNFAAGQHTVAPVSMASFDSCNVNDTLSPPRTSTPAQVTLTTAGTHYFICTFPAHCSSLNQKLSVVVTAAAPSPTVSTPSRPTAAPQAARIPRPVSTPLRPTARTPPPTTAASPPKSTTTTGGAASSPPPSGNFAAPTAAGVGFLSVVSVAAAALLF